MRICFISTMNGAPWGGSERLWSDTAAAALDSGHEAAVVTFAWPQVAEQLLSLKRRGALLLFRGRRPGRTGPRIEKYFSLWPKLKRWAPDVVFISQGNCFDLARQPDVECGLKKLDAPYVVACQHNYDDRVLSEPVRRKARDLFQRARTVAFVAERNREIAERQLASLLSNARVIRNPVNVTTDGPATWPKDGSVPQFASVARLQADFKGQDVLLDILSRVPWSERSWKLTLYGDGPDETYLKELAAHRGLLGKIEFAGFESDVRAIWEKSHLQLLPSRSEGTPLSLVEAMLCGRPAVVSDVGGNLEWVSEPGTGFVAEAPTSLSFGAAMERAWGAREKWQSMGARAHQSAVERVDTNPSESLLRLILNEAE